MRFICTHTVPPHSLTAEQVRQVSEAAQNDPKVRGYRSFMNLSAGKIVCVLEANEERDITDWFQKMNLPYDTILPLEYEGDRGVVSEAPRAAVTA